MHLRDGGQYVARRLVPHPLGDDAAPTPRSGETLAQRQVASVTASAGGTRIAVDDALPNENLPPDAP